MKQKTCISWWEKKIRKRGIILAKQFASMESVIPPSFSVNTLTLSLFKNLLPHLTTL